MKKRKKGSTLITVLALSIVFMALGGAILTAIMGTMKSNTNQKIREDLKYAAESGLEIAKSHFKKGNMTIDTRTGAMEDNLDEVLETSTVERVDIFTENINGEDRVKSIAYSKNGNKEESISIKYIKREKGSNTNIFEHGLVSGNGGVIINNGGKLDGTTSTISTPTGEISYEGDKSKIEEIKKNDIGTVEFKNWNSPEKEIIHKNQGKFYKNEIEVPVLEIEMSMNRKFDGYKYPDANLTIVGSGKTIEEYFADKKTENIIKIKIIDTKVQFNVEMILVNTENLIIDTTEHLVNKIIINNGKTSIEGGGNFTLNNSTIFANSINIKNGGNFNVTNQPLKETEVGYGIIDIDEVNQINRILSVLMKNWNSNDNESGQEKIEIIEGTFSD